ncbi:MAG: hypothetical protein ABIR84_05985 [Candidatus Nitrotoga sp.]
MSKSLADLHLPVMAALFYRISTVNSARFVSSARGSVEKLNHQPRKFLNFRTSNEVLLKQKIVVLRILIHLGLIDAYLMSRLDRYIGYYESYAESNETLDHDQAMQK